MQQCDVAQRSVKTLDVQLCRSRPRIQAYRKSHLPRQRSRRVKNCKPADASAGASGLQTAR